MIRILVVETTVFGYDGITNVMVNYFEHMNYSSIHMDLVTINPVSEKFKTTLEKYGGRNYVIGCRNRNPAKYVFELSKLLRAGKYSIIHVHGCSATMAVEMLAAKLAGVKVRIAHSHNTTCDHVKVDKILRPLFSKLCNVGFACGKEAGEWMFPNMAFDVISNGIDLEKFQYNADVRMQFRSKYGLEGKTVIGHVGRFSKQKNHEKLIDIFTQYSAIHSDSKLVLIGDGELRPMIEVQAKQRNLDVLFVGLSDEVEKWLQAMDVMIFPSLFEGLPLGLVEAQAAGLPCILSDTISTETKITDLVCYVGLNSSDEVWCESTDRMLAQTNRDAQKKLICESIQKAHFDINSNCSELSQKYELLVKRLYRGKEV